MASHFSALPWAVILEKLFELDLVGDRPSSILAQCQRAAFMASVCREWRSIVKGALNGCQSALHLIARNEFGNYLADGWGNPRAKILDSLQKSIFIETAEAKPMQLATEAVELPWAVNLLSTCGSLIVMAVSSPLRTRGQGNANGASMSDCWLGRDAADIQYALAVVCVHQTSVAAYMPCAARTNAIHLSVSGLLFAADQKGKLRMLTQETEGQAAREEDARGEEGEHEGGRTGWSVVEEWGCEDDEAIQCMVVREENPAHCEFQVALLCSSGVLLLQRLGGRLHLRHRLPLQGEGWAVPKQLATLCEASTQLLFAGSSTLRFSDGASFCTWDLSHSPPRQSTRRVLPRRGGTVGPGLPWWDYQPGFQIPTALSTERSRLVPSGLLSWNSGGVTLRDADEEEVLWELKYSEVVDAWADESLLFLLRQNDMSVLSVRDPTATVFQQGRTRTLCHTFSSEYPPETVDGQRLWTLRACCSGCAVAFVEPSLTKSCLHVWYATGAREWKAVERAHYKAALQTSSVSPNQRQYLEQAALDYFCLCLAAELEPAHLPHLHPPAASPSPSPSTPSASVSAHASVASLQVEVLRSRQCCGMMEGEKLVQMLVHRGEGQRKLGGKHEDPAFWRGRFLLSAAAESLAAAARDCREEGRLLLQLPALHPLLLRHLRLSLHPPRVSSCFAPLVANTYPDPVEIDAIGRGQGKQAAVKEWMRRWRSDIRMLVGEKDALRNELEEVLAKYQR